MATGFRKTVNLEFMIGFVLRSEISKQILFAKLKDLKVSYRA